MRLELRAEGLPLTQALRDFVERKLSFALGRFGHSVRGVRVRLTDVNGPRGGEDIHCVIHARLSPGGTLTIEETRSDAFAAVAHASGRAGRGLARRLERIRSRRRRR